MTYKRNVSVSVFDKRDNGTGIWILRGSAENHKRYNVFKKTHSTRTAIEIVELAGGIYYGDWEKHPQARALRRGEPAPANSGPTLMEMIRSGELEENNATLKMAEEDLEKRNIRLSPEEFSNIKSEPSRIIDERDGGAAAEDSVPWISSPDVHQTDDYLIVHENILPLRKIPPFRIFPRKGGATT